LHNTTVGNNCISQALLFCVLQGLDSRIKRGNRGDRTGRLKSMFTPKVKMAIVIMDVEY
jgi:hypothetical protein